MPRNETQRKDYEEAIATLDKEDMLKLFESCLDQTFADEPWAERWEKAAKAGRATLSYQSPDEIHTHHEYAENDHRLSEDAPATLGEAHHEEESLGLTAFRETVIRVVNFAMRSGQAKAVLLLFAASELRHPMFYGKSFRALGEQFGREKQQLADLWKKLSASTGLRWPHALTIEQKRTCSKRNYRAKN